MINTTWAGPHGEGKKKQKPPAVCSVVLPKAPNISVIQKPQRSGEVWAAGWLAAVGPSRAHPSVLFQLGTNLQLQSGAVRENSHKELTQPTHPIHQHHSRKALEVRKAEQRSAGPWFMFLLFVLQVGDSFLVPEDYIWWESCCKT